MKPAKQSEGRGPRERLRQSKRVQSPPSSASNPVLLAKELAGLKALLPGLDESAITRIVEKTKQPGFNPRQLEEEVANVVSAVKAAGK
jgi:hypothetical protein